jgi:hypothetical protein
MRSCTVKVNAALPSCPFQSAAGYRMPHHLATINTPLTKAEWKECYATRLPGGSQTVVDRDLPADGV